VRNVDEPELGVEVHGVEASAGAFPEERREFEHTVGARQARA
jgi:hypothetical protein